MEHRLKKSPSKRELLARASEIGIKYARERSKDELARLIAAFDRGEDIDPLPDFVKRQHED